MGSKRVGLARVEALIENLKRELTLGGATLRDFVVGGAGDAAASQGSTGKDGHFTVRKDSEAAGYHIYQEEVSLVGTSSATDHGMICYLSKTLPANAKIISAAMTVTELANVGTFLCELNLSATANTSRGAEAGTPTELIGAGVSAALACSSGGTVGDTEVRVASTGDYIDVANKTSVLVCNDSTGNGTAAITAGSVLVTIEYYGSAAPA